MAEMDDGSKQQSRTRSPNNVDLIRLSKFVNQSINSPLPVFTHISLLLSVLQQ
jgi:hypothetical protein